MFGPSNMLISLHIRSYVQGAPEDWHGSGLSDHAPALVAFGYKNRNGDSFSIPKFVCKHPNFSLHVQALADQVNLFSLPVHKQLATLKACFMEASRLVVKDVQNLEDTVESQRLIFAQMSRALWVQQVSLCKQLLRTSELARQHLHIVGNKVCVVSPDFLVLPLMKFTTHIMLTLFPS